MQFYCLHVLADGNQHIRIKANRLESSSTLLSAQSLYCAIAIIVFFKHAGNFPGNA